MTYGFIGTGNMGGALAVGVAARTGGDVTLLYDKDTAKAEALAASIGAEAVTWDDILDCSVIFLGVKPNIIPAVAAQLTAELGARKPLIVSMAAGIPVEKLEAMLPGLPIIRILPNTPVAVGAGLTIAVKNAAVTEEMTADFTSAMEKTGLLLWLEEKVFDAAGAVTSCGPAFAYMFMSALADGGVYCGLPRQQALQCAGQMLVGAGSMLLASGQHPDALKDAVCSPGGSTIEGVRTLEDGAFRSAVMNAVIDSFRRMHG